MRLLIVALFVVVGIQSWRAEQWKAQAQRDREFAREAATVSGAITGVTTVVADPTIDPTIVYAECFEPQKTEAAMLAWLRTLDPGMLGLIGYAGDDGRVYALSESLVRSAR